MQLNQWKLPWFWVPGKSQITVYDILWSVLASGRGPTIYRDYMVCFIFRYARKEHESGRAELLHDRISAMQELIRRKQ